MIKLKIVVGFVATIFMVAALWFGYVALDCFFGELAPEQVIKLPLPEQAEIRPQWQVQPGTFAIDVSVDDLIARANMSGLKTLVAYEKFGSDNAKKVKVFYWLPRTDIPGTFYRATETFFPYSKWSTTIGRLEIRGRALHVEPRRNVGRGAMGAFGAVVLLLVTLIVVVTALPDKSQWR